jgi:hypothetical protein
MTGVLAMIGLCLAMAARLFAMVVPLTAGMMATMSELLMDAMMIDIMMIIAGMTIVMIVVMMTGVVGMTAR